MSDDRGIPGIPSTKDADNVASTPPVSTDTGESIMMGTNSKLPLDAPAPSPHVDGDDSQPHRPPGTPSSFPSFSSFRLQPRVGTAVATPSPSFGSSRGRTLPVLFSIRINSFFIIMQRRHGLRFTIDVVR